MEGLNGYLLLRRRLVHANAARCARHSRRSEQVSSFPAHAWRRWPIMRRAIEYWERPQQLADRNPHLVERRHVAVESSFVHYREIVVVNAGVVRKASGSATSGREALAQAHPRRTSHHGSERLTARSRGIASSPSREMMREHSCGWGCLNVGILIRRISHTHALNTIGPS